MIKIRARRRGIASLEQPARPQLPDLWSSQEPGRVRRCCCLDGTRRRVVGENKSTCRLTPIQVRVVLNLACTRARAGARQAPPEGLQPPGRKVECIGKVIHTSLKSSASPSRHAGINSFTTDPLAAARERCTIETSADQNRMVGRRWSASSGRVRYLL
jgi:hypothetical protein